MTQTEFAIVAAAIRIGLNLGSRSDNRPFRHQIERLERLLEEVGDRHQASQIREMLNPSREPDFTPIVRS
jgi:hypothetical protein